MFDFSSVHFDLLENWNTLPPEEPVDMQLPVTAEPEVIRLLRDFGLLDDPGIQEILRRAEFTTLGDFFIVINWSARDSVRILGARTAARLCESTFRLTRLAFRDDLIRFLQDTMTQEGNWEFEVSAQDLLFLRNECSHKVPAKQWADDVRRAIRHAIEQMSRGPSGRTPYSTGGSTITLESRSALAMSIGNDFPPEHIVVLKETDDVEQDTARDTKVTAPTTTNSSGRTTSTSQLADVAPSQPVQRAPDLPALPPSPDDTGSDVESGEAEACVDGSENDEPVDPTAREEENRRHFRKKCFLNLLFLVNIAIAVVTLRYGFDINVADPFIPEPPGPSPAAPTFQPTAAPTPEKVEFVQIGGTIRDPSLSASAGNLTSFGWSVSINAFGRVVAIGDPWANDVGKVYTFRFNELEDGGIWEIFGSEGLNGDEVGCEFGNSTDLSDDGNYLAVGARNHSTGRGQASVFRLSNDEWVPYGQPIYGKALNDNFGNAVSISADGKKMAVAAAREDIGGVGENAGVVKVFEYDEDDGDWKPLGQTLFGNHAHEKFGFSIKLSSSGDVLAVGAPFRHRRGEEGSFEWGGAVEVYKYIVRDRLWVQMGKTIEYMNPIERSGWSVDLSVNGGAIAVGAPVNDDNGEASGQVRVYEFNSTKQDWQLRGSPMQGQDLGSWFGNTVGLSSDGLKVVTALWCDLPGVEPCDYGLRMYTYNTDEKLWKQLGDDLPGKTRYDPYSTSAAMAKDDTVLMTSVDLDSGETVVKTYRPEFS